MTETLQAIRALIATLPADQRAALFAEAVPAPAAPDKLLRTAEAAARLGVKRETLLYWRKTGKAVGVMSGKKTLGFRESEINRIIGGAA